MNDPLLAIKPAVFVGSSRKDLRAFPGEVRREIGQGIFAAQLGEHPVGAKPLKGFGGGVLEIRDNFDSDTYRAVYTVRFEGVLYVLHAFQKNRPRGSPLRSGTSTLSGSDCARPRSSTGQAKEPDHEQEESPART